jgi:hypothetical protein
VGADTSLAAIGRPNNCDAGNELVSVGAAGRKPAGQEDDEEAEAAGAGSATRHPETQHDTSTQRVFCSRLILSMTSRLVFKGTNRNRNLQISFQD